MPQQSEPAESVRRYYDALGEREWSRLAGTVRGRVILELHRRFLRRFVRPGWRVLEVGAGPGRFTLELAALGCRIVVTDVSEVQLALNEARLGSTDAEPQVERRELPSRIRPPVRFTSAWTSLQRNIWQMWPPGSSTTWRRSPVRSAWSLASCPTTR